ncbi:SxtJ family membrane protein, partial [Amylibacter sp.]|nr:SxtJ family membrane protein [Amylibacter sp.]
LYFFQNELFLYSKITFFTSLIFLFVTILKADLLFPLNKMWMTLGLLLSMVASPILMGVIFFCLFTPISILMRLIGRDELFLKPSYKKSFWKDYNNGIEKAHNFKYQF